MDSLIRTRRYRIFGRELYRILGLSLFTANSVPIPSVEDDPPFVFAKKLLEDRVCSAHIDGLSLEGDTFAEAYGPLVHGRDYIETPVSLHGESYYLSHDGTAGYWIPHLTPSLFQSNARQFDYSMTCDALAFYVGYTPDKRPMMEALLSDPRFAGAQGPVLPPRIPTDAGPEIYEEWLNAVTGIYDLIFLTNFDSSILDAYTRNPVAFDMLVSPLSTAVKVIERSPWYQEHRSELVWDDDFEQCLVLPSRLRRGGWR